MLNGIAPILIFNFKKLLPQANVSGIPLLSSLTDSIPLVPIPIYLDERLSGIYIQSESKNIDVETEVKQAPGSTQPPTVEQRGINSTITINMVARTDSIGINAIIAMSDLIFGKLASNEYSVTYIHKSITVFGGLVHSFSCQQSNNNNLYDITLVLSKATGNSTVAKAAAPTIAKTSTTSLSAGPR